MVEGAVTRAHSQQNIKVNTLESLGKEMEESLKNSLPPPPMPSEIDMLFRSSQSFLNVKSANIPRTGNDYEKELSELKFVLEKIEENHAHNHLQVRERLKRHEHLQDMPKKFESYKQKTDELITYLKAKLKEESEKSTSLQSENQILQSQVEEYKSKLSQEQDQVSVLKNRDQIASEERRSGLNKLLEVTDKLNKQFDNMQEMSKSYSDYRQEKEIAIITLNNQLQEERLKIIQLASSNEQLKAELSSLSRKVQEQDQALKNNETEKNQLLEASKADKQANSQLNDTIKTMTVKVSDLESFLTESDKSRNELQRKYADAEKKIAITTKQVQKLTDEVTDLTREKKDALDQLVNDRKSRDESQTRLTEMNVQLEETIATLLKKIAEQDAVIENVAESHVKVDTATANPIVETPRSNDAGDSADLKRTIEDQNTRILSLEEERKQLLLRPLEHGLIQKYSKEMEDLTVVLVKKESEFARDSARMRETIQNLEQKVSFQENEVTELKIQSEENIQTFSLEVDALQKANAVLKNENVTFSAQILSLQSEASEKKNISDALSATQAKLLDALSNADQLRFEKVNLDQKLENTQRQLEEQSTLLVAATEQVNSLNAQVTALSKETEEKSVAADAKEKQLAYLESTSAQSKLESDRTIQELTETVQSIQKQLSEAKAQVTEREGQNSVLSQQINDIFLANSALQLEIVNAKALVEEKQAALDSAVEEMRHRKDIDAETISNLHLEIDWLRENIAELEGEIDASKSASIEAKNSLLNQTADVESLRTQIAETLKLTETEVQGLKESLLKSESALKNRHEEHIAISESQLKAIDAEKQQRLNLEAEVKALQSKLEQSVSQLPVDTANEPTQFLQTELGQIRAEREALALQVQELESDNQQLNLRIDDDERNIEQLNQYLDSQAEKCEYFEELVNDFKAIGRDPAEINQKLNDFEQEVASTILAREVIISEKEQLQFEIDNSKSMLQESLDMTKRLETAIADKDAELEKYRSEIATLTTGQQTSVNSMIENQAAVEKFQKQIDEHLSNQQKLAKELETKNIKLEADTETIASLHTEIDWLQDSISHLEKELASSKDAQNAASGQIMALQSSVLLDQVTISNSKNLLQESESQRLQLIEQLKEIESKNTTLSESLSLQEIKKNEALTAIADKKLEIEKCRSEIAALTAGQQTSVNSIIENQAIVEKFQKQIDEHLSIKQKLTEELEKKSIKLEADTETIASLHTEIDWLQDSISHLEKELASSKDAQHAATVQVLALQSSALQDQETIANSKNMLQESESQRLQFAEKFKEFESQNASLNESLKHQEIKANEALTDIISIKEAHKTQLLDVNKRLEESSVLVETLRSDNEALKSSIKELELNQHSTESEMGSQLSAAKLQVGTLTNSCNQFAVKIEELENEAESLKQTLDQTTAALEHAYDQKSEYLGIISTLKAQAEDHQAISMNNNELQSRISLLEAEKNDISLENSRLSSEVSALRLNCSDLASEIELLQNSIRIADSERAQAKSTIESLQKSVDESSVENSRLIAELEEKNTNVLSLQESVARLEIQEVDFRKNQQALEYTIENSNREFSNVIQANASLVKQRDDIIKQLRPIKSGSLISISEEEKNDPANHPVKTHLHKSLSSVFQEIEELKSALRESEELRTANTILCSQLKDIESRLQSETISMTNQLNAVTHENALMSESLKELKQLSLEQAGQSDFLDAKINDISDKLQSAEDELTRIQLKNSDLVHDIDNLNVHNASLQEQLKEQVAQYSTISGVLAEAEQKLITKTQELNAVQSKLTSSTAESASLQEKLSIATQDHAVLAESIKELIKSKAGLEQTLIEEARRNDSLESSISVLKSSLNATEAAKLDIDMNAAKERANLEEQLRKQTILTDALATKEEELRTKMNEIQDLQSRLSNSAAESLNMREKLEALNQDHVILSNNLNAKILELSETLQTKSQNFLTLETSLSQREADILAMTEKYDNALQSITDEQARSKDLQEQIELLYSQIAADKSESLKALDEKIQEVEEIQIAKDELKETIDDILLQMDNYKSVLEEIESLRRRQVGRARSTQLLDSNLINGELTEKQKLNMHVTSFFKHIDDYKSYLIELEESKSRKLANSDLKQSLSGYFVQFDPPEVSGSAANLSQGRSSVKLQRTMSNSKMKFSKMNSKGGSNGIDIAIKKQAVSPKNSPKNSHSRLNQSSTDLDGKHQLQPQQSPGSSPASSPKGSLRKETTKKSSRFLSEIAIATEESEESTRSKSNTDIHEKPLSPIINRARADSSPKVSPHASPKCSPINSPKGTRGSPKNSPKGVYKKGLHSTRGSTSSKKGSTTKLAKSSVLAKTQSTSSMSSVASFGVDSDDSVHDASVVDEPVPVSAINETVPPSSNQENDTVPKSRVSHTSQMSTPSVSESMTRASNADSKKVPPPVRRSSKPRMDFPNNRASMPPSSKNTQEAIENQRTSRTSQTSDTSLPPPVRRHSKPNLPRIPSVRNSAPLAPLPQSGGSNTGSNTSLDHKSGGSGNGSPLLDRKPSNRLSAFLSGKGSTSLDRQVSKVKPNEPSSLSVTTKGINEAPPPELERKKSTNDVLSPRRGSRDVLKPDVAEKKPSLIKRMSIIAGFTSPRRTSKADLLNKNDTPLEEEE